MICKKCSQIPFCNPAWRDQSEHHLTFEALDGSAKSGCQVCALFRKVLLEYYADHNSCSIEEAELGQRRLDCDASFEDEAVAGLSSTEITSAGCPFVVVPVSQPIIRATPQSEGVHRVLYIRTRGRHFHPIDEVFPFLEISSGQGACFRHKFRVKHETLTTDTKTASL